MRLRHAHQKDQGRQQILHWVLGIPEGAIYDGCTGRAAARLTCLLACSAVERCSCRGCVHAAGAHTVQAFVVVLVLYVECVLVRGSLCAVRATVTRGTVRYC